MTEVEFMTQAVLPLEQMIGNMIIMGFEGTNVDAPAVTRVAGYLEENLLGGAILFRRNIENPEQLLALTTHLRSADPTAFIAIDQEGGRVQRLRESNGFTNYPSAKNIATEYSSNDAYLQYSNMAEELKSYGFNLNFGPCVDLDDHTSPIISKLERSYGEEPARVVEYAASFINAHRDQQVFTAIKHFPGHGFAIGDTHLGLVDVTDSFQQSELSPFYQLIEQNKVDMIMTAHILDRNIDDKDPITLSNIALKQLLRDKNYHGVIITDDLFMGAILEHYTLAQSVIKSIVAGSDMMIFSNNKFSRTIIDNFEADYDLPHKVIAIVKDAIAEGVLTIERIVESFQRIQALKKNIR